MSIALVVLGLLGGAVVFLLLRAAPRGTAGMWVATLFFVPIWVGVSIGPFWSAITLVTLLSLATCSSGMRLLPVDALAGALVFIVVSLFAVKLISLPTLFTALTEWIIPYIWGRLILTRVSLAFLTKLLASAGTIAAFLAIIEAAIADNPFVRITFGSTGLYQLWGVLQERGGLVRVEGAFGHSIALGATLAMMSAFVLAAPWRLWVRLSCLAIIVAATALTLSRIGLVTLVLTIVLSVVALPSLSRRARVLIAGAGVIAAGIVVPLVSDVFLSAGQEAGGSAAYRWDLFSLVRLIPWFGSAADLEGLTINGEYFGDYAKSVDNAVLVAALRVGLIPTAILVALLIVAIIPSIRVRGASAAGIAVAGQLPGLFAVAFITQYAVIFWFIVGLAVSSELDRRRETRSAIEGASDGLITAEEAAVLRFPRLAIQRSLGGGSGP